MPTKQQLVVILRGKPPMRLPQIVNEWIMQYSGGDYLCYTSLSEMPNYSSIYTTISAHLTQNKSTFTHVFKGVRYRGRGKVGEWMLVSECNLPTLQQEFKKRQVDYTSTWILKQLRGNFRLAVDVLRDLANRENNLYIATTQPQFRKLVERCRRIVIREQFTS